jgi:hypothetical protein
MTTTGTIRRTLVAAAFLSALVGAGVPAEAQNNVVYIHGSRMTSWPSAALLRSSGAWTHRTLFFNGSARLQDATAKAAVTSALNAYCTASDCVVACYSAGCNRLLLALHENSGTSYRILWTEALASAAGGTENAKYSTNKGLRLLAKAFLADVPPAAAVDNDLTPEVMRNNYGHVQNIAPSPVYHLAGSKDICLRLNAWGVIAAGAANGGLNYLGQAILGGPVSWVRVIASVIVGIFRAKKAKFCGNTYLPGRLGDGIVPVHSAAGYADTGAHASHADGGPKYTFRAYEQVPLFPGDHRGLFGDFVAKGSLRLAINASATCPNLPAPTTDPDASIVFEDADGAVQSQSTTDHLLMICGVNALSDPTLYSTCAGFQGCCDNFEEGTTSGCTCGEALCAQSAAESYSYYTDYDCAGIEYSEALAANPIGRSWDGFGMVGTASSTVTLRSRRASNGTCHNATHARSWSGGCTEYSRSAKTSTTARRVYRAAIADAALADPAGGSEWPGWVVGSTNNRGNCP